MKITHFQLVITCLLVLTGMTVNAAETSVGKPLQLPAIQVVPIQDSGTSRDYELYVKLPEDYDTKSHKKHPVIYIVDGLYNIEVISGSIEYFVKDAILVGISWEKGLPAWKSRMRDYTPVKYPKKIYKHPTGQADAHIAFIKNDVFKYIESNYKTAPHKRTFYGFSMGGSFGSYILLTQPNTFKNYILGSPGSLYDGVFIHEHKAIAKAISESIDANVFLSVGADEELIEIEHALSLTQLLKAKTTRSSRVKFSLIESANHGQAFPFSAIQSLEWLAGVSTSIPANN